MVMTYQYTLCHPPPLLFPLFPLICFLDHQNLFQTSSRFLTSIYIELSMLSFPTRYPTSWHSPVFQMTAKHSNTCLSTFSSFPQTFPRIEAYGAGLYASPWPPHGFVYLSSNSSAWPLKSAHHHFPPDLFPQAPLLLMAPPSKLFEPLHLEAAKTLLFFAEDPNRVLEKFRVIRSQSTNLPGCMILPPPSVSLKGGMSDNNHHFEFRP